MVFKRRTAGESEGMRPTVRSTQGGDGVRLALAGEWTTRTVAAIDAEMRAVERSKPLPRLVIDLTEVARIDTAGAWLVQRLVNAAAAAGAQVAFAGVSSEARTLIGAVRESAKPGTIATIKRPNIAVRWLEALGRGVYAALDDVRLGLHILGATIRGPQMKAGRGRLVNFAAIATHIDRMGIGAIPVIVLMSAIVGGIVAQQGAFQLRFFGAEIFVVDLVGILILRELGVLLTAIMIAGRTGSAITAEIGSMKMREEVDALTVIGLNPVGVLVFPRLLALAIALPCLTIIADLAAMAGAIYVTWAYSGISPEAFIDRLRVAIDVSTVMAGLIKAPFMAMIIGIVASVEGMKVEGSAESLGRRVTASVVKAIFIVIVIDGFFAVFYAAIGF
ncbi:MAG: ABC transporter permease [Rhizobiaceae bacterium]|nr:ABC transporter permease [Rhizobiaceae bacterium]